MAEGTSQGFTLAIDAPLADHLDPDMPEIGRVVENLRSELPNVCRDLALLADQHYAAAAEATAACSRWTMRPAAVMLGFYRALLHELLARGWQQLDEPVRTPARHKLVLMIRHGLTGR
jgi:hypothetical protein